MNLYSAQEPVEGRNKFSWLPMAVMLVVFTCSLGFGTLLNAPEGQASPPKCQGDPRRC